MVPWLNVLLELNPEGTNSCRPSERHPTSASTVRSPRWVAFSRASPNWIDQLPSFRRRRSLSRGWRIGRRGRQRVMEAAAGEALAEVVKGLDAFVGAVLGFLEFLDRLVPALAFEVEQAELEPQLEIVRVFVGELPGAAEFVFQAFRLEPGALFFGVLASGSSWAIWSSKRRRVAWVMARSRPGWPTPIDGQNAAVEIECGFDIIAGGGDRRLSGGAGRCWVVVRAGRGNRRAAARWRLRL